MHDLYFDHEHELEEDDFPGCCLNCRQSLIIIKAHILSFYDKIRRYTPETLRALSPKKLYQTYQLLDDIAHLEVGDRLAELVLADTEIRSVLPAIRSYYATFFSLHEPHLAQEILKAADPWAVLESFPLYPRYHTLVEDQLKTTDPSSGRIFLAFIGCGPVPLSLILLSRFYGICSVGLDVDAQAVSLAKKCIARLGLEHDISIVQGDESRLRDMPHWNAVLIAALAEPKRQIFQRLHTILGERGTVPVCYRTYTGIRAVLYRPVKPEDIEGFKIVKQINPSKRVNNTLVFLAKR